MTAAVSLKLYPRDDHPPAQMTADDQGRTLTAPEVAAIVLDGRHSTKWVIQRMGPDIGSKPGRDWFFNETEARTWWKKHLASGRRANR